MFTLLISSFVLFLPLIIELPFPLVVFCVFFVVCCLFPPIGCRHFIFFPHWNLMAPQVSKGCGRLWLAIGRLSHTCTSGETWGRKSFPRSFGWKYLKCFVYIFEEQLDGGFNPLWKIFVKWEHFPRNVWNHHPDKHDSQFTVVFFGANSGEGPPSLEILYRPVLSGCWSWGISVPRGTSGTLWYLLKNRAQEIANSITKTRTDCFIRQPNQ